MYIRRPRESAHLIGGLCAPPNHHKMLCPSVGGLWDIVQPSDTCREFLRRLGLSPQAARKLLKGIVAVKLRRFAGLFISVRAPGVQRTLHLLRPSIVLQGQCCGCICVLEYRSRIFFFFKCWYILKTFVIVLKNIYSLEISIRRIAKNSLFYYSFFSK